MIFIPFIKKKHQYSNLNIFNVTKPSHSIQMIYTNKPVNFVFIQTSTENNNISLINKYHS